MPKERRKSTEKRSAKKAGVKNASSKLEKKKFGPSALEKMFQRSESTSSSSVENSKPALRKDRGLFYCPSKVVLDCEHAMRRRRHYRSCELESRMAKRQIHASSHLCPPRNEKAADLEISRADRRSGRLQLLPSFPRHGRRLFSSACRERCPFRRGSSGPQGPKIRSEFSISLAASRIPRTYPARQTFCRRTSSCRLFH